MGEVNDKGKFRLRLVDVEADRYVFAAEFNDRRRSVSVLIEGDHVRFPHVVSDGGISLGDEALDRIVRERAGELLVLRRARGRPRQ